MTDSVNLDRGGLYVRRLPPRPARIAMLAPPWIPIPPPGYGGIESVVDALTRELVTRGHEVTLFAAPGSQSAARVRALLDRPSDEIGLALVEADFVARAFAEVDEADRIGEPFDVVHDHSGFVALAMADRLGTPLVHTLHGPFTPETCRFYACHHHKATMVGLSEAQLASGPPGMRATVVPNPIDASEWPLQMEKDDYLLFVGRMAESKGPHRAIEVARRTGRRLVLAGPVQEVNRGFFEKEVSPQIDGDRICYVGEVGGRAKAELFAKAAGLLMPIRWPEPFGMVMVEAMVCGTPVIALRCGSAPELIEDGETGVLVDDESEMADAVARLAQIDPERCRREVVARFDIAAVTDAYLRVYAQAAAPRDTEVDWSRPRSGPSSSQRPQHAELSNAPDAVSR